MRVLQAAALVGAVALSGCVDVDMTATITGADAATCLGQHERFSARCST